MQLIFCCYSWCVFRYLGTVTLLFGNMPYKLNFDGMLNGDEICGCSKKYHKKEGLGFNAENAAENAVLLVFQNQNCSELRKSVDNN